LNHLARPMEAVLRQEEFDEATIDAVGEIAGSMKDLAALPKAMRRDLLVLRKVKIGQLFRLEGLVEASRDKCVEEESGKRRRVVENREALKKRMVKDGFAMSKGGPYTLSEAAAAALGVEARSFVTLTQVVETVYPTEFSRRAESKVEEYKSEMATRDTAGAARPGSLWLDSHYKVAEPHRCACVVLDPTRLTDADLELLFTTTQAGRKIYAPKFPPTHHVVYYLDEPNRQIGVNCRRGRLPPLTPYDLDFVRRARDDAGITGTANSELLYRQHDNDAARHDRALRLLASSDSSSSSSSSEPASPPRLLHDS